MWSTSGMRRVGEQAALGGERRQRRCTISTTSGRRLPPPSRSTAPKPQVPTSAMPKPNISPPVTAPVRRKDRER